MNHGTPRTLFRRVSQSLPAGATAGDGIAPNRVPATPHGLMRGFMTGKSPQESLPSHSPLAIEKRVITDESSQVRPANEPKKSLFGEAVTDALSRQSNANNSVWFLDKLLLIVNCGLSMAIVLVLLAYFSTIL